MTDNQMADATIRYVQAGEDGPLPSELDVLAPAEQQRVLDAARRYVAASADQAIEAMVDRLADDLMAAYR